MQVILSVSGTLSKCLHPGQRVTTPQQRDLWEVAGDSARHLNQDAIKAKRRALKDLRGIFKLND